MRRHPELTLVLLMGFAILFAMSLEHFAQLDPCPLCLLQRLVCVALIITALITLFVKRYTFGRIAGKVINSVLLLTGTAIGIRHVWIQHLPKDQAPPECGASLDYLMQVLPIQEVLSMILTGSGECQKISASFLSFSLAEWTLAFFLVATTFYGLCLRKP